MEERVRELEGKRWRARRDWRVAGWKGRRAKREMRRRYLGRLAKGKSCWMTCKLNRRGAGKEGAGVVCEGNERAGEERSWMTWKLNWREAG